MCEHEAYIQARALRQGESPFVECQHPVRPESQVHLACHAVVASYIRCHIEEALFVECAVCVRCPAVLVPFQDIQRFHGPASYSPAYVRPCFLQPPAAVGQYSAAACPHVAAAFQLPVAVGCAAVHCRDKALEAGAQVLSEVHAQTASYAEGRALRTAQGAVCRLGGGLVAPEQIARVQHHASRKTLIHFAVTCAVAGLCRRFFIRLQGCVRRRCTAHRHAADCGKQT